MILEDLFEFWFKPDTYKRIWFSATSEDDKTIYNRFGHYLSALPKPNGYQDYPVLIILYDQIVRHLDRYLGHQNKELANMYAPKALELSLKMIDNFEESRFYTLKPEVQVMLLMPLRHTFKREYLERSLEIINRLRQKDKNNGFYRRFWQQNVINLGKQIPTELFDPALQCDSPPEWNFDEGLICPSSEFDPTIKRDYQHQFKIGRNSYNNKEWNQAFQSIIGSPVVNGKKKLVIISGSGGTDSSVAAYHLVRQGYQVIMAMVNYGNRETSNREVDFLKWLCYQFGIKLYYRNILEIKKSRDTDREFYEEYTKKIRFSLYQEIYNLYSDNGKEIPVILGHNKDDALENIFTNLRKSIKTSNLMGMRSSHHENGILIVRPMLSIWKDDIMIYAREHGIPYLYDSTPKDCWRGILRHQVIKPILDLDRGDQILESLCRMAKEMEKLTKFHREYFVDQTPITLVGDKSYQIDYIKPNKGGDFNYWDMIFDKLRKDYSLPKPKVGSIKCLVSRLKTINFSNNMNNINIGLGISGAITPNHITITYVKF